MVLHADIFETRQISGENWLCAFTKPGREFLAAANAEIADYETYLPLTLSRRNGELSKTPLFGRYLFVKGYYNHAKIRAIEGIDGLISQDSEPVPVRPAIIAELRSREQHGIIPTERPQRASRGFTPGMAVRLTSGAQTGLMGVVERMLGRHRASVAVHAAGRSMRVSVPIVGLIMQETTRTTSA